jgi:hypothetical protein
MKKFLVTVVFVVMSSGAYAVEISDLQTVKASDVKVAVQALPVALDSITDIGKDTSMPTKVLSTGSDTYHPQECVLDITYTGMPPKHILLDLDASTKDEESFGMISGSLFIKVLTKKMGPGIGYYMTVTESKTGVTITANSNPLIIQRNVYKASISCYDKGVL